jgi:hypothetical protein
MQKESYTQCKMERQLPSGAKQFHTAFIPTSFAKIGRSIEIMADSDDEGSWSAGWVVVERGASMDRVALELQRSAQKNFATKLDKKQRR